MFGSQYVRGRGAAADVDLEGNYTSWAYLASGDCDGDDIAGGVVRDDGTVLTWADETVRIFNKSGTELLESADKDPERLYAPQRECAMMARSILGKYVMSWDGTDESVFHIFKDNALQDSIDVTDDVGGVTKIRVLGMSPNGKYAVVMGYDGLRFDLVMIYEGS